MLAAIVFDFDGVILESVDLKARAFRRLFGAYPEHQERIVCLHLENSGMSRYEKFRRIYEDFLHMPLSEAEMRRLDREFAAIIADEMRDCPYVAGARKFVERRAAEYSLFIASGTPESELHTIVTQRGLSRFFVGVYGSPRSKPILLREIRQQMKSQPEALLFIGDALQDYQAALETGVPFVGRVSSGGSNPFPEDDSLTLVCDLLELENIWSQVIRQFA